MVDYINTNSFIHRLNPITKLVWTFVVIIVSFMLKSPQAIFIVFLLNIAVAAASRILPNMWPVIKGLAFLALLLILFQIFFVTDGNTIFYCLPFWNIGRVTDLGLQLSMIMSLRMLTTISTIPIFMMTTPMTDTMVVLVEKLRIPYKYAFMFITALRFIPVLMDEMGLILQAQMSRGYNSDTRNPLKKLTIIIPLAIPLLISSIKRTEKTAVSMVVRGFGSGPRSHFKVIRMRSADYWVLGTYALILVLVTFYLYN